MVDTPSLEARLRCLGTLLQQLNAQTACAAVNEAIERLATLSAPEASSDYVLVPREPTREMLNAAVDVDSFKLGDISALGFRMSPQQLFERCYAAMIAAANPAPPTSGGADIEAQLFEREEEMATSGWTRNRDDSRGHEALASAATALYMAGRWECASLPTIEQVALWEGLRDALGFRPGTATSAGVHATQPTPADESGADVLGERNAERIDAACFRWLCLHPHWGFIEQLCREVVAEDSVAFHAQLVAAITKRWGADEFSRIGREALATPTAQPRAAAQEGPSLHEQIEDILDRAEVPCREDSGRWMTLPERLQTFIRLTRPAGDLEDAALLDWLEENGDSVNLSSKFVGGRREYREPIGTSRAAIDAARRARGADGVPVYQRHFVTRGEKS